jgi:hypothetical protein
VEAEDPLSQLADIHLPDAVSFWPPAPGWWLLLAVVLFALTLLWHRQYLLWQQNRRLQLVLAELARALRTHQQQSAQAAQANQAGLALLYACNSLLKRVALLHHGEAEVAPLSGSAWLNFLDRTGGNTEFTIGAGKVLGDGEYRPRFEADAEALYQVARHWIVQQYQTKKPGTAITQPDAPVQSGAAT